MLFPLEQIKLYSIPFCVSCALHIGIFQFGVGSSLSKPQISMKNGNSVLELKLMPSLPSKASLAANTSRQEKRTAKNPVTPNPATTPDQLDEVPPNIKEITAYSPDFRQDPMFHTYHSLPFLEDNLATVNNRHPSLNDEPKPHPAKAELNRVDNKNKQTAQQKTQHNTPPTEQPVRKQGDNTFDSINSAQQEADLHKKGAVVQAQCTSKLYPHYPRSCRRRGEQGSVRLKVTVTQKGTPVNITVIESSGYKKLDSAAVRAVREAEFIPASLNGSRCKSTFTLTITFRLEDV